MLNQLQNWILREPILHGPSGPCFELIYNDNMVNEGWIGFRFTIVYKSILVIMQGCIGDSE